MKKQLASIATSSKRFCTKCKYVVHIVATAKLRFGLALHNIAIVHLPSANSRINQTTIGIPNLNTIFLFQAQFIAQSIGQAFQVAYVEFLKANGIEDHSFVKEMDYQEVLNSQEIFGNELALFAKKELQKEVLIV